MKTLSTEFTKLGFHHRQIERSGNVAIFERRALKRGPNLPAHSRSHFEVVRILVAKPVVLKGDHFPEREIYPPAEQWGLNGFTCHDLPGAQARARTLSGSDGQNS